MVVTNPGIEQQKIIVQNNCGEKLVGLLHETGSKEVIILCHGFRCTKDDSMMVDLAFALEKQGISVFRFDFSGNGESEGTFGFGNHRKEVEDLQAVIQYFKAKDRVISAILGHSKGGIAVLLYASLHRDIQTVINVCGRCRTNIGIEDRLGKDYLERATKYGFVEAKSQTGEVLYRVTKENILERLNTDMYKACTKIDKDCRVLTIHGSADEITPLEDALEFSKVIRNHELQIVEGADHFFVNHRHELVSAVVDFIK